MNYLKNAKMNRKAMSIAMNMTIGRRIVWSDAITKAT